MRTTSKLFRIDWRDILNTSIMSIGTPVIYAFIEMLPSFGLGKIETVALSASITYILKKFFTPKQEIRTLTSSIGLPKQPK